tara:strand:+ start:389 stop:1747 length:1359 start_codon:yes stop_codon:yes gene_type:complete
MAAMRRVYRWIPFVLLLAACGDDGNPTASPEDGGVSCASNLECDDGLFCNGAETCDPADPAASPLGCVAGEAPPCAGACDETADTCPGGCTDPDMDRDGVDSVACGGDDCDDADPNRFPGNAEVCDEAGHDEDCDPTTLGFDLDGDGFVSTRCCNVTDAGMVCGEDCDDLSRGAYPGATDACNGADDDCDGAVDEEATLTFYRDADGDGFGLADGPDVGESDRPIQACERPDGYAVIPGDCDDSSEITHPGGTERCAPLGLDEDCDGAVDEFGEGATSPAVDLITYYRDRDRDGWGKVDDVRVSCAPPAGSWSIFPGDCRDDLAQVNPDGDYARLPACPDYLETGDTVVPVRAERCGGTWVCVESDAGCARPVPGASFEAWWDMNCDGEVRSPPSGCIDESDGTCGFSFGGPMLQSENACGTGSGTYAGTTACTRIGEECVENGTLGALACR